MKNNTSITLLSEPNLVEKVARKLAKQEYSSRAYNNCTEHEYIENHWIAYKEEAEELAAVMTEENERYRKALIRIQDTMKSIKGARHIAWQALNPTKEQALGGDNV